MSLSFLIFLHWFCFMKRKTSKYSIAILFPEIFSLSFGFLSCFSVSNPFFLSLLFPDFKLCFLFNINVFSFKKNNLKSTKKTIATKRFFLWTCVLQNVKSYLFFCPFFAKFWLMFKKHYKNRYFSKFLKAKKQKMHFEVLLSGASRCYYLGQVDCIFKMTNLAQIITPQICARNFVSKESAETPTFIVFFDKQCFVKTNLAQIITPQKAKLGPDNNTTAYICIYIYRYIYR